MKTKTVAVSRWLQSSSSLDIRSGLKLLLLTVARYFVLLQVGVGGSSSLWLVVVSSLAPFTVAVEHPAATPFQIVDPFAFELARFYTRSSLNQGTMGLAFGEFGLGCLPRSNGISL